MIDNRKVELAIGDHVIYSTRQSSSTYWHYGVIEGFRVRNTWGRDEDVALVKILDEEWGWSDKKRLRQVTNANLVKLPGELPARPA